MDKENNNSLTSFQFEPKDNRTSEEGVLSKILDKVKSAVSGQPTSWTHDNASMHSTHSERRISNSTEPSVISIPHTVSNVIAVTEYPNSSSNSSTTSQRLPKDSVLANFPVSSDSLSKSSTIATTATTVIVGKHGKSEDMIVEPAHSNSTVQFIMPSTSNSNNRKSLEENSVDLLPLYTRKSIDSDTQSVATNFSISNSNSLGRILARLRGQKNDKEFWMPDEQCKECYKCRKPFTLLRRKHHCRTCGQIFCGKCASHIVSGKLYKQKGQVRVCNFCYKKQQQQLQEKSINSTTEPIMHFKTVSSPLSRQIITDNNSEETSQLTLLDQAEQYGSEIIPSQKPPLAVPNMQIPTAALKQAKGAYGNENTTTFALEIPIYGSESYSSSQLERPHSPFVAMAEQPTSPTLYNTSTVANTSSFNVTNTPDNHIYTGVKRLLDAGTSFIKPRPRSNTSSSAPLLEDFRSTQLPFRSVPYLDHGGGTVLAESELSSFPSAVVDPDEQYEDEAAGLYDRPLTPLKTPLYSDKPNSSNSDPLSPATNGGISDDESYDHRLRAKRTEELRGKNVQLISSKSSYHSYRRLSITGPTTPKLRNSGLHKINTVGLPKYDYPPSSAGPLQLEQTWSPNPLLSPYNDDANKFFPQSDNNNRFRFVPRQRRTSGPPPTVELSLSARQHARLLLRQFMQDIQFTESSKEEWEDVIMNILMKVANNVQPDTRAGDDMDVRHYVKIKKIPGGLPSDSFYVKGVVCTKNVAHKRMVRNMSSPRILILLFSLDYSRVEMENQLLSITPVISQEREHISKLVGRIVALKPSLLLVKSTVSRFALEFLLEANIPVIHNVKHSVIEAVARCTEAAIVTSVDKLQHGVSFGRCGSFEIRTFMHEWIPNRRKTYLIFDDCSPELGGTIVLRGEKVETLKVIKRLIDFMVFVVNNLKYETSLLRDSFAKNRGASESEERKRSPLMRQSSLGIEKLHDLEDDGHNYTELLLQTYQNTILSVSQFVTFKPPYLLLKLKETEERLAMVIQQKRKKSISCLSILKDAASTVSTPAVLSLSASPTRTTFDKQARSPMEKQQSMSHPASTSSYDTQEGDEFTSEFEQELITKSHQIARAWEAYHGETPESISPLYHQNIVVLYSSVCTVTTVPCQGPEIRIFGYYRIPSDKTLGQYIMDLCADAHQPCTSFMCDHPMLQHYRSYAHGNARVNVMIEQFPCPLPGMSDKLLMWSYCRECNKPTPVLPMSENTWNYSFGKFLEIFLYQEGVHCRADICPHDMAKNHVRYFGYMDMTVRFQYDPIELLEVSVPPMKLYIKSKIQRDLKEAELKSLRTKINRFYQSIVDRNKAFPFDLVDPRKLEACKAELQELSLEAQGEKKDTLQLLQNVYATSDPVDTLTINGVRRSLFQIVAHWEAVYADFVRFYLEPERELKKITTIHLRKMFPTDFSDMNTDERTKRATEVTDLPLLGIGLDDNDGDALIGRILKKKSTATIKPDEFTTRQNNDMVMPALSSTPSSTPITDMVEEDKDEDNMASGAQSDNKTSFLRPEIRRRLSLELMREFNEKLKYEEVTSAGAANTTNDISSFSQTRPNKYLQLRVSGSLSAAYTPSRIPLYSGKNNSPLSVYQQSPKQATTSINESKTAYKATVGPSNLSHVSSIEKLPRFPPHQRHHSIAHDYHIHQRYGKSKASSSFDDNDEFEPSPSFLRRSATSKDRRFRSRLPRKKTYIQVYDQANDLVREDIDDEFYPGDQADDTLSISSRQAAHRLKTDILLPRRKPTSYRQARHQRHLQLGYHAHESGTDADNDDDSDDEAEEAFDVGKSNVDYFTPIAPFTFEVLDEPETNNKLEVENTQGKSDDGSTTNYAAVKPYFGLSDGQVDLMSGISGDDETDQDFLPLASDLLMAQQSANDALTISDLHNIHPELTTTTTNTSSSIRYITATANDENRHSPEKMSFMKTITNFLTDSGIGNLLPLESPLQPTEYLFPDSYVVVREDEPSTIIAYTLSSEEYLDKMHDIQNCHSESGMNDTHLKTYDSINIDRKAPSENYTFESGLHNNIPQVAEAIQETLLRESGSHMRYNFSTGSTKFFCKIFFSEQFDALRRNCGCDESYIMSLASCIKWDSSGGKSGSAFLKTKDDRLLMKQMSRYELDAFLGFAPAYFQYMSEAFFSELPTALAKIFGFYSIGYKNSSTGKSMRMDVLVMENLFYQRNIKKIFDLKGSMRNRHVQSTGKQDEVLLDENLVELIYQSPLFIRAHSKEILRSSLHNDTLFLSNRNVMDYSLLVGIDADRQELVVGIVDFIRTFTWDKKLESWVKESGILGGGGKEPTIVSPRQYRIRFREAMERYFLMVPDFWALTRQNRALYTVLHHHTASQQAATSSNDENA
ncbi:Putative 1-phosphatidylinositol-3-phosphate 5-kinase [Rhizopus microsporus]|nr:Putative 1-phosphatidylinositol-3-phosphate 5-kinase [Rhizopus microsporus]